MNTKYSRIGILIITLGVILVGCSTTKNLPEDEVLYIGIKDIRYVDQEEAKKKSKKRKSGEDGVITSIADAYESVENVLAAPSRDALIKAIKDDESSKELSKEEKLDLKHVEFVNKKAFETASSEVDAALSCAPNNALLGSSSIRIPFPFGLWVYNDFVHKKRKFGKWVFKDRKSAV